MAHPFIDTPQYWQQYGEGGIGYPGNGLGIVGGRNGDDSGYSEGQPVRFTDSWAVDNDVASYFEASAEIVDLDAERIARRLEPDELAA